MNKIKAYALNFIHYVRSHQILVDSHKRIFGILYTLLGWFLIALSLYYFNDNHANLPFSLEMFVSFLSGTLLLFIISKIVRIPLSIKISTDKDQRSHFSITARKIMLYVRGSIAVISYTGLVAAKKSLGLVDDSAIFGADALIYALLMWWIIKEKRTWLEWVGILVGTVGVVIPFVVNIPLAGVLVSVRGGLLGIMASIMMSVIFFMNAVLVRHEYPIRIAFYQCLMGVWLSLILCFFQYRHVFYALNTLPFSTTHNTIIRGVLYALALIFFFRAFLYTEIILIAIAGYSLDPFSIILSRLSCENAGSLSQNLLTIGLITIGTAILYFEEHQKQKRYAHVNVSQPVYEPTIAENYQSADALHSEGQMDTSTFLAKKRQFFNFLYKLSEEMLIAEITKIEFEHGKIYFSLFDPNIRLECDDEDNRSSPLDLLQSAEYWEKEFELIYAICEPGAHILDFNGQIGWLTLNLAKKIDQAKLYCFEPEPDSYEHLKNNVQNNQCSNVQIFKERIANRFGQEQLILLPEDRILISEAKSIIYANTNKFDAQLCTIDYFFTQNKLSKIDLVIGQATGNELEVIQGAQTTIESCHPIFFLELFDEFCYEFDSSVEDIIQFLEKLEYQKYQPTSHEDASHPSPYYLFLHKKAHQKLIQKLNLKTQ